MAIDELPGWQAYYDAQLGALRENAKPYSQPTPDHDELMRRVAENQARSDEAQRLRTAVFATLRPSDVLELLDAIDGDAITTEQRPCLFLVAELAKRNDPRLAPADRERFAAMLEHKMRHGYLREGSVYWFLRALDRERAATELLAAIDRAEPAALTVKEAETVAFDLGDIGARGVAALRRLEMLGGEIGLVATRRLESLGHATPERIAEVAARWRRDGRRDDLDWLYYNVITRFGEGKEPIARLQEMLGEPSDQGPHMFNWATNEPRPIVLYVEIDTNNMVVAYKLK